jgi:hypothetical protein
MQTAAQEVLDREPKRFIDSTASYACVASLEKVFVSRRVGVAQRSCGTRAFTTAFRHSVLTRACKQVGKLGWYWSYPMPSMHCKYSIQSSLAFIGCVACEQAKPQLICEGEPHPYNDTGPDRCQVGAESTNLDLKTHT